MPSYHATSSPNEDPMDPWSIYKTTTEMLSDSVSLYEDPALYNQTDVGFQPIQEAPMAKIKSETMEPGGDGGGGVGGGDSGCSEGRYEWQYKHIDHWTSQDCLLWLVYQLQELNLGKTLPEMKMEHFTNITGPQLKNLSPDDLCRLFPECGMELYNRLQRLRAPFYGNCYSDWTHRYPQTHLPPPPPLENHTLTDLDRREPPPPAAPAPQQRHAHTVLTHQAPLHYSGATTTVAGPFCSPSEADSGYKSDSSEEEAELPPPPPEKRRPGRPRGTKKKKKPEKLGRLWEFIRDLLLNPMYNPSLICWEDYEQGMFRFVRSDSVAKLWGSKKDNGDMNYEKLSRAMRYYYKSQVLLPVYGKRLVYKFGPTAKGWRSERPIFRD